MSPRARTALRWTKRLVLVAFALVLIATAALVVLVHTDYGREVVRAEVQKRIAHSFVGGATVGSIEGSPFGELVLHDLVINDPTGHPAITVKRLVVEVALLPLIRSEARLRTVIASDVDVDLRRDATGALMIGSMVRKGPKTTWSVDLSHLEVHRAHVKIDTADGPVNLDGIEVFGAAHLPAIGAIATNVGLRAVWREKRAPVLLNAIARLDEGVLTVHSLNAMAGGVRVTGDAVRFAAGTDDEPPHLEGTLAIDAPARELARLVPQLKLPDDVSATIVARDDAPITHVRVLGRLGRTRAQLLAGVDLGRMRASGVLTTDAVQISALSRGAATGMGGAMIAFDGVLGEEPVAHGVVTAWGQVNDLPPLRSAIAFATDGTRATTEIGLVGPAVRATVSGAVRRAGDVLTLERSTVIASTTNPAVTSGGKLSLRGALTARLEVHGRLSPGLDLAVDGTLKGTRLRMNDLSVASLDLAIDATGLPRAPRGKAEVVVEDLVRGDLALGQVKVTAANQPGGTIAVAVRSRPKFAPWLIDVDAIVTPPAKPRTETWLVDVVSHRVRAGTDGEWTGTTGHLEIAPGRYAIHNFASTSELGQFTLSGSVAPHHLDIDLVVQKADVGRSHVIFDIDAPADITNIAAWRRLPRSAIRAGTLELDGIDLGRVAALFGKPDMVHGHVDGKIAITPTATTGTVALSAVTTPATAALGALDATLQFASDKDEITPSLSGTLGAIGRFRGSARMALPERPFDPRAWRSAGPRALRGASFAVDEVTLDPSVFQRLGIAAEVRGKVAFSAEIGEGARGANLRFDVRGLRGEWIGMPVDAHVEAVIDDTRTTASARVSSGRATLVEAKGEAPLSLQQLLRDPSLVRTTRFTATGTIPNIPAPTLLAFVGRSELSHGTVGGTVAIEGTLAAPSVVAKLTGTGLQVLAGRAGRQAKVLDSLVIDASYTGGVAKARIRATQRGGFLDAVATADPRNLAKGSLTVKAKAFDLQPLLVFAPGPLGAGHGRLDADLAVTGLDPRTARLAGSLRLTNARVPIAPQIGTLRRTNIDVKVGQGRMTINADGKLGPGTFKIASAFALDGTQPTSGDATITLRKVSPIGNIEPTIDADAKAKLRREPGKWIVDVTVKNATVNVPGERGTALKPVGPPSDMVYATGKTITSRPMRTTAPERAAFVLNVTLEESHLKTPEARSLIKGKATISASADAIGINGTFEAYRGDLELFGRRYQIDRAIVVYDGSWDPRLDLRVTHDFPDLTTVTSVTGRLSKPKLAMTSNPASYSQSELLGFLLGGEPNGDPAKKDSARDVATNAGASFIANRVTGYAKKALPVDIDVVRYEGASPTESAVFTIGSWVTRSLFLAYRRRIEARPDENANEAEVEYWLSRRVMVEGTTGDRGVTGLDLLWRKRY